jgi:hypothetical protein
MATSGGVVMGHANCDNCTWTSESYKNILALAANHAKHHKHQVRVEVGYAYIYDGRGR